MSADPVTMFVISAGKALFDIKESKNLRKTSAAIKHRKRETIATAALTAEVDFFLFIDQYNHVQRSGLPHFRAVRMTNILAGAFIKTVRPIQKAR